MTENNNVYKTVLKNGNKKYNEWICCFSYDTKSYKGNDNNVRE